MKDLTKKELTQEILVAKASPCTCLIATYFRFICKRCEKLLFFERVLFHRDLV